MAVDGVAVIVAESLTAARDAAEAIQVDYEVLPAGVDVEAALEPRAPLVRVEVAADRDGTLLGIRVSVPASMGAHLQLETAAIAIIGPFLFRGPYQARGYHYECTSVFTNQAPTSAYRGAGRPEATYAIERMMDLVAREVGLDPAEGRRRNFLPPGEAVENAAGITYDSVNHDPTLDRALELAQHGKWRKEQARRWASKDPRRIGVGLAGYVDSSGIGPSAALSATRYDSGAGNTRGFVSTQAARWSSPTARWSSPTASTAHGQGHATTWAQIAVALFGVNLKKHAKVNCGETVIVPMGMGTFGSRSLIVGGRALFMASERVSPRFDVSLRTSWSSLRKTSCSKEGGSPWPALQTAPCPLWTWPGRPASTRIPLGMAPWLEESVVFDPPDWTYTFGAHVAVAGVDQETGHLSILQYMAVDDCGRVVNPTIVEGQVHGGITQGIGQALLEKVVFSEDRVLLNPSLATHLVPPAAELPELLLAPDGDPLALELPGCRGHRKAGTLAPPPALINAVHDAVGFTVEIYIPAHSERVWHALHGTNQVEELETPARW